MSSLADDIIGKVLQRQPTAEDYRRLRSMLDLLPLEVRSSPGAMVDMVIRIEFQRQLEETLKQATWSAQQRIHEDLPKRVDAAAARALDRIRDLMPIDAADSARRMYKWGAILMAFTFAITAIWAYVLGQHMTRQAFAANAALVQSERNRCVDAAIGRVAVMNGNSAKAGAGSLEIARNDLLICIAESGGRHADGS